MNSFKHVYTDAWATGYQEFRYWTFTKIESNFPRLIQSWSRRMNNKNNSPLFWRGRCYRQIFYFARGLFDEVYKDFKSRYVVSNHLAISFRTP